MPRELTSMLVAIFLDLGAFLRVDITRFISIEGVVHEIRGVVAVQKMQVCVR
jgi:hypothetical protein